jgi:hypothetical protein
MLLWRNNTFVLFAELANAKTFIFSPQDLRKLCETSFLDLFLDTESRQRFLHFLHTDETSADLAIPRGLRVFLQGAHGPVSMDLFHTRIPSTIGKVAQEKERQCDTLVNHG